LTTPTGANLHCTGLANLVILCNFLLTSATSGGATTHFHFTHGPVDFRIVLPEPAEAKNHLTLAKYSNCKLGSLSVVMELQDDINDIANCSLFVRSSIYVTYRDSPHQ